MDCLNCAHEIAAEPIRGSYVSLTPVSMDGLQDFHEYSIKPELYKYLEFPPFETLEDSQRYLERLIYRSSVSEAQYWFIRLSDGYKVVGTIGLHSLDDRRASVEIGYGLSPAYWGKGIFTSAAELVVNYAFTILSLRRIVARTSVHNLPSLRALERLGFRIEGVMRDYYRGYEGERFDGVLLSRLSTDK